MLKIINDAYRCPIGMLKIIIGRHPYGLSRPAKPLYCHLSNNNFADTPRVMSGLSVYKP